jgi:signal peptidase II
MNSLTRRWLFLLVVAGVVLALDQFTKNAVINNLMLGESQRLIPFLYPFFQVTRSENNGAAFGFLPQAGDIFLIIALVVVVIMVIFYPRVPEKARLTRFALGLIVGGALGNAFDRINHGAVIDFIHYTIPGIVSNVSNLADHAIVIGVLVIVLQSWRTEPENQEAPDAESGGIPQ